MTALELKPCPFCGEPAEIDTQQSYRNFMAGRLETGIAVYCVGCGAQTTLCRGDIPDLEPEMVVNLWNARHNLLPAPDLLDALKAYVEKECDYMTRNNLGDPEKQHTVTQARAAIKKAEGEG